jgi:hypothetical protein
MADNNFSKAEIEELRSLIKLLQKDVDSVEFDNLIKSGKAAKDYLQKLREEASNFASDISEAVEGFQRMINEIKNTNTGVNKVAKSFQNLSSIAEKIQYHQRGISELTEKDIKQLQEKQKKEKVNLENVAKLLKLEKQGLDSKSRGNQIAIANLAVITNKTLAEKLQLRDLVRERGKINKELQKNVSAQGNILGILKDEDTYYNQLESSLASINTQLDNQKRLLGLGGTAIEGMGAALNKLGFGKLADTLGLDEAKTKMKETADSILEAGGNANSLGNKFKVLRVGAGSMGASLIKNLKDPLSITLFLVDQIVDAFKIADSGTGDLAKSFNLTYKEASNVRDELNTVANLSGDINVTTQGLQESMVAVGAALGSNARLNEADLVTMTKLTKQAGYTHDELIGIQKISLVNGKTLEDNTAEILGSAKAYAAQNKLVINEKEVLKEVNKASSSLKLSLGLSTDALAEAVVKSKQFGLNLDQAEKIASSLLDFESSITSELEAELLTGKSFNFERARALALEGKVADAASEVANQIGSAKDFGKLNVIQQEAIAKSIGMQRDELSQSLIDKEALTKLSAEEGESAQQAFNRLVKTVGIEEAKKRLGDDALANQFEQQSIQEKFNTTIEKLKEIFISLVQPLLPILDIFTAVLKPVGVLAGWIGQLSKFLGKITGGYLPILLTGFGAWKLLTSSIFKNMLSIFTTQGRINIAKKLGLITEQQAVRIEYAKKALAKDYVRSESTIASLKKKSIASAVKENIVLGARNIKEKAVIGFEVLRGKLKKITAAAEGKVGLAAVKTKAKQAGGFLMDIGRYALKAGIAIATIPVIGPILAIAAIAAAAAGGMALYNKFNKAGDVMSPSKGKTQISTKEGGLFELSKNDDVIAAPGLLSDNNKSVNGKSTSVSSPSINLTPLIERMSAVENVLIQILNKDTNVYMDSTKVGTALNVGTVRIQ